MLCITEQPASVQIEFVRTNIQRVIAGMSVTFLVEPYPRLHLTIVLFDRPRVPLPPPDLERASTCSARATHPRGWSEPPSRTTYSRTGT